MESKKTKELKTIFKNNGKTPLSYNLLRHPKPFISNAKTDTCTFYNTSLFIVGYISKPISYNG